MNWLLNKGIEVGGTTVTYAALAAAAVVLFAGFTISSRVTKRIRAGASPETLRWRVPASQVAGYALRFVTVAVALQITGVDVGSLLAAGAVLAVGIGIAMQKVAENFVSGIILFAERSIREGDVIHLEGQICKVTHVGIRATVATTLDNEEYIVPNSLLAQSAVKNLTLTDRSIRLRAKVGVDYGTDVERAMSVLTECAAALPWLDPDRRPVVLLTDFGASSIDFEVSVWARDVWALRTLQSELRVAMWRALRDAKISIPFPQLDLHVRSGLAAASPSGR